jgi:hypothetical protein
MWKTINKLTNKSSKTTIIAEIKHENQSVTVLHLYQIPLILTSTKLE